MDQIEVTPLQEVVDDLSARLGLPVLLDDRDLQPLAYSSQVGHLDAVRTASILRRGAPQAVRDALLRQGIAAAEEPLHLRGDPGLEMEARVCVPIAGAGGRFGYIWIIEEQRLSDAQLLAATEAARTGARDPRGGRGDRRRARRARRRPPARARPRRGRGRGAGGAAGAGAAAAQPARWRCASRRSPAATATTSAPGCAPASAASDRRVSEGLALCGEVDGLDLCVAAVHDSALRAGGGEVGELLRAAVEQVAPPPGTADRRRRGAGLRRAGRRPGRLPPRAAAALRAAQAQAGEPGARADVPRPDAPPAPSTGHVARWDALGADRLLALLPPHELLADLPPGVAALLAPEHATLRLTLEAYLDRAGDVKATAEALQLHRTGLYHRLHRIEQLAGIDLHSGEDRLLCQLALRVAKLA